MRVLQLNNSLRVARHLEPGTNIKPASDQRLVFAGEVLSRYQSLMTETYKWDICYTIFRVYIVILICLSVFRCVVMPRNLLGDT